MIIRASYVGGDADRVRHLLDAENNEVVIERHDLDVACPPGLGLTLEMHAALAAANPRAKIKTVHVKCSPSLPLTEEGIRRLIDVVRREHHIPPGHPMKVIIHAKGNRPMHIHLLFPAVNPTTGKVLSSKLNYRADELASRVLEIDFGESITPGPRIRKNEETLRQRGEGAMAAILANYEPVRNRTRDSENDRQQGARTKMPPKEFRRLLARALASAGPSLPVPRALARAGFAIALGDRRDVLMAVHLATGAGYSLERSLERIGPSIPAIEADDLDLLRAGARPLAEVVRDGLIFSHRRAEQRVDSEIRRGVFEAAIDGESSQLFSDARRKRAHEQRRSEERMSLKARREAIRKADQAVRRLRQRRIDRAFRFARILQSRRLRKTAFLLAACGALLAGAGFSIAVGAGLATTAIMSSRARALRADAATLIAMRHKRVSADSPRIPSATPAPRQRMFDFNAIPKDQRVLVGIALRHLQKGFETGLTAAIGRALGQPLMEDLQGFLATGSDAQKKVVLSWAKDNPANAFAAASALRRAGEAEAADGLVAKTRRTKVKEKARERHG